MPDQLVPRKFKEFETVKLLVDLPGRRVRPGNVGAIADISPANTAPPYYYLLEFVNYRGQTYGFVEVREDGIVKATEADIEWDRRSPAHSMDVDYSIFEPETD